MNSHQENICFPDVFHICYMRHFDDASTFMYFYITYHHCHRDYRVHYICSPGLHSHCTETSNVSHNTHCYAYNIDLLFSIKHFCIKQAYWSCRQDVGFWIQQSMVKTLSALVCCVLEQHLICAASVNSTVK